MDGKPHVRIKVIISTCRARTTAVACSGDQDKPSPGILCECVVPGEREADDLQSRGDQCHGERGRRGWLGRHGVSSALW